jgi:hypothetical protein
MEPCLLSRFGMAEGKIALYMPQYFGDAIHLVPVWS